MEGGRKLQKTKVVCDRCPLLANPDRHLLLGQTALLDQSLIAHRDFDRVEILALDILHDRHLEHSLIVCITDVCRNHVHACKPACPESALSADDLVSAFFLSADRDRLYQAECPDRIGKLVESFLVEVHSRLIWIRFYHVDRDAEYVGCVLTRPLSHYFLMDIAYRLP